MIQQDSHPALKNYTLLLQEPYISIFHNKKDDWLYVRWEGNRSKETLIAGAQELLKYLKETGVRKLINDSTFATRALPEAVEWVSRILAPKLAEAGLEYLAWIYNDSNQFSSSADAILSQANSDIIVLVFDQIELAEIWLRSVR